MSVTIDTHDLESFERNLNPVEFSGADSFARVLGYGEISTVFQLGSDRSHAYKRMPLFTESAAAEAYSQRYRRYCEHLQEAGIQLPPDALKTIAVPGRLVVLYIIQKQYPREWFAHHLIHRESEAANEKIFHRICEQIDAVLEFNSRNRPKLELALDGQLSNWLFENGNVDPGTLLYVDTSTPLFRIDGVEQLDPELFLKSAPGFLRWIIRRLFLEDVMNRYYDRRQVLIDLAANLYKEQRSELLPLALQVINDFIGSEDEPIESDEIRKYYKEDKMIWTLFLAFRRIDRWLKTRILRQHYDFLLPGKIQR